MFRIYCPTVDKNRLIGVESLREMVTTSDGPVAYVECGCGALVIVQAGTQIWHGPPSGASRAA